MANVGRIRSTAMLHQGSVTPADYWPPRTATRDRRCRESNSLGTVPADSPPPTTIWDFLTTPADVIPAAVALAALVLGVINLTRSIARDPRPRLKVKLAPKYDPVTFTSGTGGTLHHSELVFSVENRGRGTAEDVRVTHVNGHGERYVSEFGTLRPDDVGRADWSLSGESLPFTGRVTVAWQRGARTARKSKRYRVKQK